MRRLDSLVAEVLANARRAMDKAGGAAVEAAPPLMRRPEGEHPHMRNGEHHPITSTRRMAKNATGIEAKISAPK